MSTQEIIFQSHEEEYLELAEVIESVVKNVGDRSKRIYHHDAGVFANWMLQLQITPRSLTRDHMRDYHNHLGSCHSSATSQRMWSVAKMVLTEYVDSNRLAKHPGVGIDGFETADETTHIALTQRQAEDLVSAVDVSTLKGKRDYVILLLLVRLGLRRFECEALNVSDLSMDQGHHILYIHHGKGDKRGIAKVPVEVRREIDLYLDERKRSGLVSDILFTHIKKNDMPVNERLSAAQINRLVKFYAKKAGISEKLSAHGLRATFITLALDADVPLHKVQYAARHKKPETTERYHKRKLNLDENAVDVIQVRRRTE